MQGRTNWLAHLSKRFIDILKRKKTVVQPFGAEANLHEGKTCYQDYTVLRS
jgi:hypothetical protein